MSSRKQKHSSEKIPTILECGGENRGKQTVAADMDGALLVGGGGGSFPYLALIAFDVGGIPRLLLLVLAAPLAALMRRLVSESAAMKVLIFAAFAGVRVSAIKSAASAVLPKHYAEEVHPETWRVLSSCGRKCVLTANPRIMVEPFLRDYLGVDVVLGTEIASYKGFATGLVAPGGVLVGYTKAAALENHLGTPPDVGIGGRIKSDFPFMRLCKERYLVPRSRRGGVRAEALPKPVIFHDGRLVRKPSPLLALAIILWLPIGIILSILRVLIGSVVPISKTRAVMNLLGCPIIPHGPIPSAQSSVVFVCCHRTVLDAIIVSACLGRMTTTISYSVPGFTERLSPIKSSKLTRDRPKDARLIEHILNDGKCLVMCPEGTTCREPYLLRFSSLFAELADRIVPVAVAVNATFFHGSTARGHKWLDPFFFYMNPRPVYQVTFLHQLPPDRTCASGKSSHEVANYVQKLIAEKLGFKCTDLTRRDKYRALAGTDGLVR